MTAITIIGDALLDRDLEGTSGRLTPDAPVPVIDEPRPRSRPGGAALAAAVAATAGAEVSLVTAIGHDGPGEELRRLVSGFGIRLFDLGLDGPTPCKVRIRSGGQSLARLDYGITPSPIGAATPGAVDAVRGAEAVLVADYGRGMSDHDGARGALASVARHTPVVWDPHPRGSGPDVPLRLATPSEAEARSFTGAGAGLAGATDAAAALSERWGTAVAVTLGAKGALLSSGGGSPLVVPARPAPAVDACGAGDCFAATAACRLAEGRLVPEAVEEAVEQATMFVESGGASGLELRSRDQRRGRPSAGTLAERVRAAGGTLVAAGGCFDLLHPGHLRYLASARRLGDALVVCLNGDASVRALKGPGRPVMPAAERAALLSGLECVDAVEIFDEPTPSEVLRRLRPPLFAKGADYGGAELPEAAVVREWGGQVVLVPYVSGRSSTRLIERVATAATRNGGQT